MTAVVLQRNCYLCSRGLVEPGIACDDCQTAYPDAYDGLVNGYAETLGEAEAARRDRVTELMLVPRPALSSKEVH
jgi:hypothetical protein